jgi:hypothetical protein
VTLPASDAVTFLRALFRGTFAQKPETLHLFASGSAAIGAFGSIFLDTIPATERAILLAEIFSRGR